MKYMLLIYETPEHFRIRSKAPEDNESWGPWRAYYKALLDAGVYLDGAPLEEFTTGTTVRPTCPGAWVRCDRPAWPMVAAVTPATSGAAHP